MSWTFTPVHVSLIGSLFAFKCSPTDIRWLLEQAWIAARDAKDYSQFAPVLEEWVALTNEACACIDPSRPAYDVRPPSSCVHTTPVFRRTVV